MEKKAVIKKIVNVIGKVITILSLVFIVMAIRKLGFDFSAVDNIPQFLLQIILGGIVICATVFLLGIAWGQWLNFFSQKHNSMKSIVCVYAKANIGKYLPGNVMHYVERNMFAGNMGISQKKIALSSVFEVAGQAGIAVVIAFCFSQNQLQEALQNLGVDHYAGYLTALILLAIFITVILGTKFRRKIQEVLAGYTIKEFLLTLCNSLFLYAAVLLAGGAILVSLYIFMGGTINFSVALQLVAGYIIAWVLGFVVPGAPGGIGVREFVLTLLLGSVVGEELILTLSVLHRLVTIIGDFLAYIVRIFFQDKEIRN
ncbi:MAG: hypothetical protein HFH41_05755 [Lachnospiraceae bacterium]|nr:hypothetical protein [Lachnospiraceae bacterium]